MQVTGYLATATASHGRIEVTHDRQGIVITELSEHVGSKRNRRVGHPILARDRIDIDAIQHRHTGSQIVRIFGDQELPLTRAAWQHAGPVRQPEAEVVEAVAFMSAATGRARTPM